MGPAGWHLRTSSKPHETSRRAHAEYFKTMDSIGIALTLGPQQSWDQQNGIRGRVQGRGLDWTDDDYMVHNNGLGVTATVDLHSTAWYAAIVWKLQLRWTCI